MRRLIAAPRRLLAIGTLAASAVVVAASYGYAAVAADNQTYTGCLQNGDLTSIAVGSTPFRACGRNATQISWSQTGPPGVPGTNGTNGTHGSNGISVTSATEPAGANCADGGSKFTAANGVTYACNGAKGDKGDSGENGTADLAALQGSPCTLHEDDSASLDVRIDQTGVVSISCRYEVKATVTGGVMTAIFIDSLTGQVGQKSCIGSSSCSTLILPATNTLVTLQSGADGNPARPFHYTCPGGSSQAATSEVVHSTSIYRGLCNTVSLSGNFAVTASFDG